MLLLEKTAQELGRQPYRRDLVYAQCGCGMVDHLSYYSYLKKMKRDGEYRCAKCNLKMMGERQKKKWNDGEYDYIKEAIKKSNNKRRKRGDFSGHKAKEWWASDEGRKRRAEMQSEQYKKKMSDSIQKVWQNDDVKSAYIEASRKLHKDDEYLKTIQQKSKEKWSDPEYAIKTLEAVRDPKHRQAVSEQSKSQWQDPDFRNKMLTIIRERWSDPVWKGKWLKIMRSEESRKRSAELLANRPRDLMSNPHKIVSGLLDDLGIGHQNEFALGPYSYDIFIPKHNLLIEVNGDWVHNQEKAKSKDRAKTTYLQNFPQYKVKTIWEHELKCLDQVRDRIKFWLGMKKTETVDFNFVDVQLRQVDVESADFFLSKYHYLRGVGRNARIIGCFLNDQLIAVCCFSSLTRKETADNLGLQLKSIRELSRFCIHPDYHKKNFASWFIKRACDWLKTQLPDVMMLVSFADKTYGHDGAIYKAANWTMDKMVPPTYWYVKPDGYVMHKKTLWDHATSLHMNERQFAEMYGYRRVDGLERYRFIKNMRNDI